MTSRPQVGRVRRPGSQMVADRGEVKRTVVLYGGKTADGAPTLCNGELAGQRYRVDRADFPKLVVVLSYGASA